MAKAKKSPPAKRKSAALVISGGDSLLRDVRRMIADTRERTATAVNAALVLLYWGNGDRIRRDILRQKRAEYGEQILPTLSAKLVPEFGQGYSERNLARMIKFAEMFPDAEIVSTLSRQLGWSHFVEIIPLQDQLKRDFYAEMCRVERWSVQVLREKINGMLFERTALSRKPEKLAAKELDQLREADRLTPDLVFRDPYFLDFLGLKDAYSEEDLEAAILREIERFILELGAGFCFVARQKRIVIDGDDFHIDPLFYHRTLRRLVAIDLKLGRFHASDEGQMELYLRWLERYEVQPGEEATCWTRGLSQRSAALAAAPRGLILCEDKGEEQVELLQLDRRGIRVASYFTELPPKELLEQKLRSIARLARKRLDARPAE